MFPQAHFTVAVAYTGWISGFIGTSMVVLGQPLNIAKRSVFSNGGGPHSGDRLFVDLTICFCHNGKRIAAKSVAVAENGWNTRCHKEPPTTESIQTNN